MQVLHTQSALDGLCGLARGPRGRCLDALQRLTHGRLSRRQGAASKPSAPLVQTLELPRDAVHVLLSICLARSDDGGLVQALQVRSPYM